MTRKANRNFKRFNTMNTRRQTLLLWLATWCMPLLMNATDTSWKFRITNIGNTPHSHVTFKDNRVNSLYKDSNGFLWIGTGSTVERLNGLHTTVYTFTGGEPAGSSPSPYLVNDIQERATKEFWVATNRGLWKLDHKENIAERQFAIRLSHNIGVSDLCTFIHLHLPSENRILRLHQRLSHRAFQTSHCKRRTSEIHPRNLSREMRFQVESLLLPHFQEVHRHDSQRIYRHGRRGEMSLKKCETQA